MVFCVLTPADWDELYSQADYAKLLKKDTSLAPAIQYRISNSIVEYLIAFNQPDDTIVQYAKKKPDLLKVPQNKYQLTVVHLAVMKNRLTLVPALLKAGASASMLDAHGWLPLHHAALVSEEMYTLIVRNTKVKSDPVTPLLITSSDMRQQFGLEKFQRSLQGVKIELEPGKMSAFLPEKHLALFGMTEYTDCPRLTGEHLKMLWVPESVEASQEVKDLQMAFDKPPKVLLKKSEIKEQWGVFANEKLDFGRVLFSYSGEAKEQDLVLGLFDLLMDKQGWQKYISNSIDAEKVGNVARFINEGFPNCVMIGYPMYKGNTWNFIHVINESLQKGEELLYDYGQGEARLKWNSCYTVANRQQMRQFIKTNSVHSVEANLRKFAFRFNPNVEKTKANRIKDLRVEGDWAKLQYCFYTPGAILDLWCEGIIKAADWYHSMVELQSRMPHILPEHEYYAKFVYFFLIFLQNIEQNLAERPADKEPIIAYIRNLVGKLTSFEISEQLYDINTWLEEGRLPWNDVQASLSEAIVHQEDRDINKLQICKIYRQKVRGHL